MTRSTDGLRVLERTMLRAWPSLETIEYDGWILRFAGGYTKRANSVNPLFGSTLPAEEKIARCEALYAERGLPTIFRLTPFAEPENIDRALAESGYGVIDRSFVMTAPLDGAPNLEAGSALHLSNEAWFAAFERLRDLDPAARAAHRRIVESAQGERCFALVEKDDVPIACGLGILVDGAVGLFDLFTTERHRRRGYGAAVVGSILRWARHRGARTAFLQAHSENTAAHRLYGPFGFSIACPYWYRARRAETDRAISR